MRQRPRAADRSPSALIPSQQRPSTISTAAAAQESIELAQPSKTATVETMVELTRSSNEASAPSIERTAPRKSVVSSNKATRKTSGGMYNSSATTAPAISDAPAPLLIGVAHILGAAHEASPPLWIPNAISVRRATPEAKK